MLWFCGHARVLGFHIGHAQLEEHLHHLRGGDVGGRALRALCKLSGHLVLAARARGSGDRKVGQRAIFGSPFFDAQKKASLKQKDAP